jgi:hypothetical protein
LQHNIDAIKVESDASVQSEEDSTDMKTDEVCIPSTSSFQEPEPQVIFIFDLVMFS